jgi:hypothetical protein
VQCIGTDILFHDALQNPVDEGQQVDQRLSRAGLRATENILAVNNQRD